MAPVFNHKKGSLPYIVTRKADLKYRIKYEDRKVAFSLFEQGSYKLYVFSFDLESGNNHIGVANGLPIIFMPRTAPNRGCNE